MRNNNVLGIVFASVNDQLLGELTSRRSVASVPFGGRYRLVDFALSNLVNAGVSKVGLITKANYQSLMDHIGSAKSWGLDRKNGGLHILPPYGNSSSGVYVGQADALYGIKNFLRRSSEQYAVICNSNIALNIDVADMIEQHVANGADITVAYRHGALPKNAGDIMSLTLNEGRVSRVLMNTESVGECDYSLGITVISRMLLMALVDKAVAANKTDFARDIIMPNVDKLRINGYEHKGFAAVMDSMQGYVDANMQLLAPAVRCDLFNKKRPVYTKVKDSMPTRYGIGSQITNSLIADGCVIEGTVKNSILFRGVRVGKGAHVENCIIMQGTEIESGADLKYLTIDKEVKVGKGRSLCGSPSYYVYINKGADI